MFFLCQFSATQNMSFPFFRPGQINLANEFECQKKKWSLGEITNSPETESRKKNNNSNKNTCVPLLVNK